MINYLDNYSDENIEKIYDKIFKEEEIKIGGYNMKVILCKLLNTNEFYFIKR